MDDLRTKLEDVRERIAHYTQLLEERAAAAEASRGLLDQGSTYPRRRNEIESELLAAEMDLRWIRPDLAALVSRERILEADFGELLAHTVELAAVEKARAAKAAQARRAKPADVENESADASEEDPATAGT